MFQHGGFWVFGSVCGLFTAYLLSLIHIYGNVMDFYELNRLEGAILDLYDRLPNEFEGRRMFTWNFGMKGGEL